MTIHRSAGHCNKFCICNDCNYNELMDAAIANSVARAAASAGPRPRKRKAGAGAAAAAMPYGCSCIKLRRLMRVVTRFYDAYVADCGLKTTQYSFLSAIAAAGPLSPGDLARLLSLDASTVTRNLRPLLAAGWLVQQSGADARSRSISLTPAGRRKRAEARALWKRAQLAFNQRIGDARVAELHRFIEAIQDDLAGSDGDPIGDQP